VKCPRGFFAKKDRRLVATSVLHFANNAIILGLCPRSNKAQPPTKKHCKPVENETNTVKLNVGGNREEKRDGSTFIGHGVIRGRSKKGIRKGGRRKWRLVLERDLKTSN